MLVTAVRVSHLLPQRREEDQGGEQGQRLEEGGAGGSLGTSGGGGGGGRVGVFVTADAGQGLVSLVALWAAEVAVSHVPAEIVVAAGEACQLAEVLVLAAPLAVAAGPGGA